MKTEKGQIDFSQINFLYFFSDFYFGSLGRFIKIIGLLCVLCIGFGVSSVPGQDTVTGAFQGDVSDNLTGNPIPGAAVEIKNEQTGFIYNLTTDSKGRFYQGLLSPGFYQIRITINGYKARLLRREIKVSRTGEVVPVPVSLEPENASTSSSTSPQPILEQDDNIRVEINTTDARRDESFKEQEITKLPLGETTVTRSFDELGLLASGVAPAPQTIGDIAGPGVGPGVGSAGQFSVNGLRSRENNFTVDGSDNNDEDIGVRRQGFVALIPQPIESVREFQIITLLAPAQFGRNIGGQVNVVSKAGGNEFNGTLYGFFNSNKLNARNFFDTTNQNGVFPVRTSNNQTAVFADTLRALTTSYQSSGEDSFTSTQTGGTLGGAVIPNRLFYFLSGEFQKINANQEKSFAVPTIEQRGPFRTGATGINLNFFNGGSTLQTPLYPTGPLSNAVFSLFPFPNNPTGVFGENTFTRVLPASGRGVVLSGRLDDNFSFAGRQHSLTGRYNFTDDKKDITAINEAIFSTLLSKTQTHNLSLFLNSELSRSSTGKRLFNQVRFSFGRTRLNFDEIRDTEFLIPSDELPDTPFLLNAPAIFNVTLPQYNGQSRFSRIQPGGTLPESTENVLGPLGQIIIAGFSPLGVDVYNFPQNRVNKTFQIADELTWQLGKQAVVFGTDIRRTDLDSDLPRLARSLITFNGSPRLERSNGNPCANGGIGDFCFLLLSDPRAIIRPEDLAGLGAASNSLLTFNVDRPDSKANLRYYQLNFYGQDTWRISPQLSLSFGLRYEYNTPVKEVNNLIEQTFSDERLDRLPVLKDFVAGRTQLYKPDYNNFAPRLGLAYSTNLLGDNRISVFRLGYGIFYGQILGAVVNQSRNVFPAFLTLNLGGVNYLPNQFLTIANPANDTVAGTLIPYRSPGTLNLLNLNELRNAGITFADIIEGLNFLNPNSINVTLPSQKLEMPMAHHYTFTFEQQLSNNFSVSFAYVGTLGKDLLRFTTPNLGSSLTVVPTNISGTPTSGTNQVPRVNGQVLIPNRPFDQRSPDGSLSATLGAVNQFETTASSVYNSLQAELRGRFINSLNFMFSYTFSKVNDDVSDVFDLAGAYALPQNSSDLRAEWGPANFDVRHRWTYEVIYSLPKISRNNFLRYLTDNLEITSTGHFYTGQPFTVNSVVDVNLDGNLTDRLNTTRGIKVTGNRSQPLQLSPDVNTSTLLAPFGKNGQIGRNSFRAGDVLDLNLSIIKQFSFGENRLSFRTDIFNFINRANFGVPIRLLEAPGFGRATSTVTPARRIQFSLKYEF